MSVRELTVLLWWMSSSGSALWRYYINSWDYSIFSTRSSIEIEYEGPSFTMWRISRTCKIQNLKSPRTKILCAAPGIHTLKPEARGQREESRNLNVDNSHICFMWYYTVVDVYENLTQTVTIWVYDPESSSKEELQWTATRPSQHSRVLTKLLNTLGQHPYIHTLVKKKVYVPDALTADGTWVVSLPMSSDDLMKEIRGNKVAFQDCFISNLAFLLTFPVMTIAETPGDLPLTLPRGSPLMSTWSSCIPTFAVLLTDRETFQTNNSFRTWTRIRVPPGILSDAQRRNVSDVALFNNGIMFLINGAIYLKTRRTFEKLDSSQGVPETEIIGIQRRRWCPVRYLFKNAKKKSLLAIWTKSEFYLGYSEFRFMKIMDSSRLKAALKLNPADTVVIQSVEYTWHPLELALILYYCSSCTNTKHTRMLLYNEDSTEWTIQDFQLDLPMSSNLVAHFLYSALPDLILWDAHRVYYYYKNFTVSGTMRIKEGEENLSKLSDGSKIHNVIVDRFGSILIKMENNVMFFSKADITNIIKLHIWANSTIKSALFFNKSSKVYLVYFSENYLVQRQEYPLFLEIESSVYQSDDQCPYLAFQHNIFSDFYFIDKGETLTIWTQIVYPENRGLSIIIEHYGPKILTWTQDLSFEIASGLCTKSMYTTFSQTTNYESVKDYFKLEDKNTGLMLVQFRPSEFSKTCPMAKQVFEIAVGCDANKHIQVRGEYLRDSPPENVKIRYDVGKYGCPRRLEFNEPFHPIIELYDENGFVKIVEANFIVWEIHGRNDYTFNYTMKQSGCINEAQTFKSMIEENKDLPLDDVWGPQNYKTCFSYAVGKPGDLNQPYEILNHSNKNHLLWPMDHSGMYVFRVKILDPNFSFCNLTSIFAIETFGVIPSPSVYLVVAFLFVLMLTFISILVLSYFWYTKIYRQFIFEPLHKPPTKLKKN
ncbi:cation channel sperm-associated auxiliary subunit epsilon isoform X2 [Peromyscus californicus insignis]|uniref:cation channel sperm-associated auxiliary subunit epsilon isoform X2 n=1 Tax=Peromyscus californicus insignis TaxID=564181 RepID=UPI0022A70BF6|nr:cation channel sperm-associated auxiliary subunit epsilon isoform X2 [Peromyscus californicus insignis]